MTVVFNVDTNCYVMKNSIKFQSDKRGGISNCKKCNGKKEDDLEGYDDDHSDDEQGDDRHGCGARACSLYPR